MADTSTGSSDTNEPTPPTTPNPGQTDPRRTYGPSPRPCPGRGPDPPREGLPPGTVPVPGLRDQHRPAQLAAISADLIAWLRQLALTPELAKAEPKALRYRRLHVPARLTTGGRRRRLRIPTNWPWATAIVAAFAKIAAIPAPG